MSAGTLTLTNNSAAVGGSGTAFTTELTAGDFILVTVGGIPYTLPVKTINSNTSLTLVSNFTGPTQSGSAWSAVPRVAMNLVTAALVAQSAEALRGLNYDKQNWQSIFSGTGNVTVKLPDGSSWTGPAWNGIVGTITGMADAITGKMDKSQNLNDLANKASSRFNLGLVDSSGLVPVSLGGTGSTRGAVLGSNLGDVGSISWLNDAANSPSVAGSGRITDDNIWRSYISVRHRNGPASGGVDAKNFGFMLVDEAMTSSSSGSFSIRKQANGTWLPTTIIYTTANTTKASDGTLKSASPVVKLFHDGSFETNEESEGVVVTRLDTGQYLIEGCKALNSDASWGGWDGGFDVPTDRNKQPLIWLDYEVNPDGSVLVKTYHRTHPNSPAFARNLIGSKNDVGDFIETVTNGEPVDIPSDQFVSVRVEMPEDSVWNTRQKAEQQAMEELGGDLTS